MKRFCLLALLILISSSAQAFGRLPDIGGTAVLSSRHRAKSSAHYKTFMPGKANAWQIAILSVFSPAPRTAGRSMKKG